MPDPGLPPPTQPAQIVLDRWLHDFWKWVRGFVQKVVAGDTSVTVTTKDGTVTITANGTSPLTTKGDLFGYSTADTRVAVGANGTVLTADSAAAAGVSWQAAGGGAPVGASYVVVALDGTLTSERVITAGTHISITDGGAGGNLTIATTGLTPSPLTTKGDLWGFSTLDARVPIGTDGDVLTADSTQALGLKWAAASGGGWVQIAQTVTSGSQASVTFSSIPSSYSDLQVRVNARGTNASTGVDLLVQFNGDTGANYDYEETHANSGATGSAQGIAQTSWRVSGASNNFTANSAPANAAGAAILDVLDYKGTTFYKTSQGRWSAQLGTGASTQGTGMTGCVYRSTAAISSIKVFFSAGNFTDGSVVSLYGVK